MCAMCNGCDDNYEPVPPKIVGMMKCCDAKHMDYLLDVERLARKLVATRHTLVGNAYMVERGPLHELENKLGEKKE